MEKKGGEERKGGREGEGEEGEKEERKFLNKVTVVLDTNNLKDNLKLDAQMESFWNLRHICGSGPCEKCLCS